MGIASVNPATGEVLATFSPLTSAEIESKLTLAEEAFQSYRQIPIARRGEWLRKAAEILERDQVELAKTMTLEMGKPIKQAIAEVLKCALVCRYYADHAAEFLQDHEISTDASESFLRYEPLGLILAVMPWNFPLWQVFRFAAPALMAGNVGILKHASNVPQCALAVERILQEAGFPVGTFQTLLVGAEKVNDLIADDRVKAATLTGSEPAGMSLASAAGKQIKKVVLELGGSDPFIVLDSADIEAAASTAVTARNLNNGQTCIAAKRFIVADGVFDRFTELFVEKVGALQVGDPLEEANDIGPLATAKIVEEIAAQVEKTVEMGGKVLVGGQRLEGPGNFYQPTILTDIPQGSPGEKEEFFGPVALLFRVKDIDEAIALANDSPFGLGASVWTTDAAEIARSVSEVQAGSVFINGMVKSDPRLPFGGSKRSGFGRELSVEGIREFVNIKTIWIK
jgi:succinate-semialdehyde dehydrogenase / glutarate-semialdehyde dehydrogenase